MKQPLTHGANPKLSVGSHRRAQTIGNFITLGCILLVVVVGVLGWEYGIAGSCNDPFILEPCSHILFVGNSYTFVNDLPKMYAALARSGGHKVDTDMVAEGGWMLADHAHAPETLNKLKAVQWSFVVLQEQSQIPSVASSRIRSMYPAARQLTQQIESVGATPIFFMTWAHRDGWPENGLADYATMQFAIEHGYLTIAQELSAPVAPVGVAWWTTRQQHPEVGLWQDDGIHPTEQGTYLAACVFYAVIYRASPVGLRYTANLSQEVAQELQAIAAETVLKNPQQWNLR